MYFQNLTEQDHQDLEFLGLNHMEILNILNILDLLDLLKLLDLLNLLGYLEILKLQKILNELFRSYFECTLFFFTGRVEEKNPVDALGMTPFRLAISNGNHSLVRLTINQNVRKTVENVTAFVGVFVAIYSAIHSFNLGYLAFSGGLIFLAALFCWGSVGALFLAFFGVVPRRPR